MARTVTRIGAFLQQKLFHTVRAVEDKLIGPGGRQHALLHHSEFDLEDLRQMLIAQGFEYHSLVDAVHELRRELTPRCFNGGALNLVVKVVVDFYCLRRETKAA